MRVVKVMDEYQLLTCFKHKLWGSKQNRLKEWNPGDYLLFTVNKHLAALAKVVGEPFYSEEQIWDNDIYPYRIPIAFEYVLSEEYRIPILGKIRDLFTVAWGPKYGLGILNQRVLEGELVKVIIDEIQKHPNDLITYSQKIDVLLNETKERTTEKEKRNIKRIRTSRYAPSLNQEMESLDGIEDDESKEGKTLHTKAQKLLIELGKITGCSNWVAPNDRNRVYNGEPLGKDCIKSLPNLGLDQQVTDKISYIDVIWLQQNAPICAFEVETTTSVYSGILRMSDLISLVPTLKIKLYIVAPKAREKKVLAELSRPTFRKIGLNDFCKFIPIEELEELVERFKGLDGHIKPSIIDNFAIALEEDSFELD